MVTHCAVKQFLLPRRTIVHYVEHFLAARKTGGNWFFTVGSGRRLGLLTLAWWISLLCAPVLSTDIIHKLPIRKTRSYGVWTSKGDIDLDKIATNPFFDIEASDPIRLIGLGW